MSPLSRVISDHLGPSLWRWMEWALAPVADWLTWKDLSLAVLVSLSCCYFVYIITREFLASTENIFGGEFGEQVVSVILAAIAFPLLFWVGLKLILWRRASFRTIAG